MKIITSTNRFVFPIIWVIIIFASAITAFNHKNVISSQSYKIVDETPIGYYFNDFKKGGNPFKKQGVSQYEIYKNSDLVIKVTATKNRQFKFNSLLTMVKVDQVYKGDYKLVGQNIYVYEWATIRMFNNYLVYQSKDGYNAMNIGDQYYLFLKFNKMPDKYKYSNDELRTYLLTNIYNSKFNVVVCENMKLLPKNDILNKKKYGDIKAWDILPTKQEQIQQYLSNRKIVLSLLQK